MATPSQDYITYICSLYDDIYDDRVENTCPPVAGSDPGEDWIPGQKAAHKSLTFFQRELLEKGIRLSTSKIKKILITGGCWTTERSRRIQELFSKYTSEGVTSDIAIKRIAAELNVSRVSVSVNLPYSSVVYKLKERSSNAKRCAQYGARNNKNQGTGDKSLAETLGDSDIKRYETLFGEKAVSKVSLLKYTEGTAPLIL